MAHAKATIVELQDEIRRLNLKLNKVTEDLVNSQKSQQSNESQISDCLRVGSSEIKILIDSMKSRFHDLVETKIKPTQYQSP